jgi:hypothetical protein
MLAKQTAHPWHRRAIVKPKRLDTLKLHARAVVGRTFDFDFAGTSDDDESYPGQHRWMIARKHDHEIPLELIGCWFPDEDLIEVGGADDPAARGIRY